ncbi:MAG: hypothetical protein R3C53_26095 [Pirellulaceae bacterium]
MALELLLPVEPAKANQVWTINKDGAKCVFNLDAVHASTLTAKIVKVESGVATIEVVGLLEATAHSVPTTLDIKGNFHAKLGTQCAIVSWVGLVIKEKRNISQAEPGFAITARIRLIRAEAQGNELTIGAPELQSLSQASDSGQWLIRLQSSPGRYEMLADRRWTTYIDGGEEAILRMIENNTIIAQCNVHQLPKLDEGTQLTLEALQAEIKRSHGDSAKLLESSEKVTSADLRLMRVVVSAEREEVPIQWIYCHLSDDKGRRVAMEFAMSGEYVERFAGADEQMSASFVFRSEEAPTPAPSPVPSRAASNDTPSKR